MITLVIILVIILSSYVLNGWVLSILWQWFFVPILGLPPLSIPQAIGIAIVVGFLTKQVDTIDEKYQDNTKAYVAAFVYPIVALVAGWIVRWFLPSVLPIVTAHRYQR